MHAIPQSVYAFLCVAAACICFQSAAAGSDYEPPVHLLGPQFSNVGPWNIPKSEFDSLLSDHSNASGNFPIAGPNISAPSSATSNIDGWSWSISVVADIPIKNSILQIPQRGQFYTGGKLTFNGPPSLLSSSSSSTQNLSVSDEWQLCLYSWDVSIGGAPYPSNLRSDDGTCSSVLSSQCMTDIRNAAQSSSGKCSCSVARSFPSCSALGNDSALWSNNCAAASFNATAIREWEGGKVERSIWGGDEAHDAGNLTAYNYVGSLAWPVMASFHNNGIQTAATTMSCVRAKDAASGSVAPTGEGLPKLIHNEAGSNEKGSAANRLTTSWLVLLVFLSLIGALNVISFVGF
jgi:hypothetical protein